MLQKKTVLIIDQNDSTRNIITDLIGVRYKNIRAICTKETIQIEEFFKKETVDLLIVDCNKSIQSHNDILKLNKTIDQYANNVPIVLLSTKKTIDKNKDTCGFTIADVLIKPFKPASLFLIIDKHINENNIAKIVNEEYRNPEWAYFKHIDLSILCKTYSKEKEKVIKVLKLFPGSITPQLEKIKKLFKKKNTSSLLEEMISIRASFLYFSKPEIISIFDNAITYIKSNDKEKALTEYETICDKWLDISAEIEKIKH